jgi:hypothetical protein
MSMPEQDGSAKHKQFSMTMQLKMKTRPRAGHAEESPALRQNFGGEGVARRPAPCNWGTHGEVLA